MTKLSKFNSLDIDIHEPLHQRWQVAIIWGTEDVQEVRDDLNDDQAWTVLQECQRRQDCSIGFTWLFMEMIADELSPTPDDHVSAEGGQL